MGILKNGFGGNYRGKIGNLVFYILNGKQVVRTIGKTCKAPTIRQLSCRQEIAVVIAFLKLITELINEGFKMMTRETYNSPFNMAVSYHKKHALQGTYPNIEMAYEKVLVTQGTMLAAIDPAVELTPEGLSFSWACPDHITWPQTYDRVMLLVYFPILKSSVYKLSGNNRLHRSEMLTLDADLSGAYMEVYISFIAENRQNVANSTYLGSFNKP